MELNLDNFGKPTEKKMEEARLKAELLAKAGQPETLEKIKGYAIDEKTGLVVERQPVEDTIEERENSKSGHN
jgi:hypothetical protein